MRRLRVLHVTPYSADAWAYGGIARLAGTLVRGLAARGHDVTVCTTDVCTETTRLGGAVSPTFRRPWPVVEPSPGVTVRIFPNLSNRLAYQQLFIPLGLGGFLRRSASSFDVAHLHACRNLPGAVAAHYLARAGVPYVIAPNGTAPRIERRRFVKGMFDAVIGRRVLRGAARVIAVSNAERRQLNAMGIDDRAIRVVPNPIDLDEFTPPLSRGRFRGRLLDRQRPVVMFLGRMSPRKRLDVLVRSFSRLRRRDAWLVIAGNDAGAAAPAARLAAELGVIDRTVFTGLLSGRDRLEALADADVVVYPSEHEIFGLVPLEALLAGTPVIVADDSGCGEVVRSTGGGQVVPLGDADRLAQAIDQVLESPSAWRALAREASARVRLTYAAKPVCAQLDDLYCEVAAGV